MTKRCRSRRSRANAPLAQDCNPSAVSQMKLNTYTRESLDERKLVPPEGHASACPDQPDRVATAIQNSMTHCTSAVTNEWEAKSRGQGRWCSPHPGLGWRQREV